MLFCTLILPHQWTGESFLTFAVCNMSAFVGEHKSNCMLAVISLLPLFGLNSSLTLQKLPMYLIPTWKVYDENTLVLHVNAFVSVLFLKIYSNEL